MNKDMGDDWMNPAKREVSWSASSPRYPRYLIERKRRLDYYPFEEWRLWKSFACRADRDVALAALREDHPAWQLRKIDETHAPRAYL